MKNDCPFCDFNEDRKLKEGKHAFVIFSNPRLMPGHLLVVSKRHIQRLSELKKDELQEVMGLVTKFEERILKTIATGCDIRQNYKPHMPNSRTHVNHLHFHLNPRNDGDELSQKVDHYRKPFYRDLPDEEKEKLYSFLKD